MFAELGPVILSDHIADAILGSAITRIVKGILKIIVVIVQYLFALFDVASCDNPHPIILHITLGIHFTAMIDKSRRVPRYFAIDIKMLVNGEHVGITVLKSSLSLLFGQRPTNVLNDARPLPYGFYGESTVIVDTGLFEFLDFHQSSNCYF